MASLTGAGVADTDTATASSTATSTAATAAVAAMMVVVVVMVVAVVVLLGTCRKGKCALWGLLYSSLVQITAMLAVWFKVVPLVVESPSFKNQSRF